MPLMRCIRYKFLDLAGNCQKNVSDHEQFPVANSGPLGQPQRRPDNQTSNADDSCTNSRWTINAADRQLRRSVCSIPSCIVQPLTADTRGRLRSRRVTTALAEEHPDEGRECVFRRRYTIYMLAFVGNGLGAPVIIALQYSPHVTSRRRGVNFMSDNNSEHPRWKHACRNMQYIHTYN